MSDFKQKRLFENFPPVETGEWLEKINADLKGADFSRKMVWKTREGFDVMPFYRREDLKELNHVNAYHGLLQDTRESGQSIDKGNTWLIRQDIIVKDYARANTEAMELLKKGVDSPGFIIKDPASITEENLSILLKDVIGHSVAINFLPEGKAREIIDFLIKFCKKNGILPETLKGAVEADPLGRLMLNGTLCIPVRDGLDYLASLTREAMELPLFRNIQINGSCFRNAGTGAVQELGFSLSMAVEYLSQLTDRGLNATDAASKIRFGFGIGTDYFIEIAKLRAARILWSLIADAYKFTGTPASRMEIHSVTSSWDATIYDPHVNLLRSQTEAMSAVLGGTDSLTILPFNMVSDGQNEFSGRIARNQQLILREEADFDRVVDPASGSYYIEKLTSLVAEAAWKLFIEIEENGGFISALESGIIQAKIEQSARERKEDANRRKKLLLGTNQFPDQDEKSGLASVPVSSLPQIDINNLIIKPISLSRASEEIEGIRIAVEKAPFRPKVFLLQAGNNREMRRARAGFAAGFFGCAGYEIIENDGYDNPDEGADDALNSGAHVIVICSSDDEYQSLAPRVHARVGDKAILVIAGNPPGKENLEKAGLTRFISLKSNLAETLRYYNSCLGIND